MRGSLAAASSFRSGFAVSALWRLASRTVSYFCSLRYSFSLPRATRSASSVWALWSLASAAGAREVHIAGLGGKIARRSPLLKGAAVAFSPRFTP